MGDDAVRDLAKGLLEAPAQIKYAKAIEEALGQWTANSPAMRALLVDYAPFGMWARAATKFVLWTLPAKHPIKTGVIAALLSTTAEERDALGLTTDPSVHGRLPDNLQGSIPLSGVSGIWRVRRSTGAACAGSGSGDTGRTPGHPTPGSTWSPRNTTAASGRRRAAPALSGAAAGGAGDGLRHVPRHQCDRPLERRRRLAALPPARRPRRVRR
jgi:hypothetical protein